MRNVTEVSQRKSKNNDSSSWDFLNTSPHRGSWKSRGPWGHKYGADLLNITAIFCSFVCDEFDFYTSLLQGAFQKPRFSLLIFASLPSLHCAPDFSYPQCEQLIVFSHQHAAPTLTCHPPSPVPQVGSQEFVCLKLRTCEEGCLSYLPFYSTCARVQCHKPLKTPLKLIELLEREHIPAFKEKDHLLSKQLQFRLK